MAPVRPLLFVVAIATTIVGCDKKKKGELEAPPNDERELLEPEEKKRPAVRRCEPLAGGREVTLRSKGHEAPSAVEVGNAVATEGGFALGVLESGGESRASILFVDGRGAFRSADLGRVHGSVSPPQVVSMAGEQVVVAVVDNDAGHTRLRLAQVDDLSTKGQVAWGPEVKVVRGQTADFALAKGLLAWDHFDKSTLRSQIRALAFQPESMKSLGRENSISPSDGDGASPKLSSREGGYWASWLSFGTLEKSEPGSPGLVDEAPRSLSAQRLDERGRTDGESIAVGSMGNVVAFDSQAASGGRLALAYRVADRGRQEGASPIKTSLIGLDGAVISGVVAHEGLGAGAPALLSGGDGTPLWITARGYESDVLLGTLDGQAESPDFQVEAGLEGKIPLSRSGDRLLVMRPDGLALKLSTLVCSLTGEKTPNKAASSAK